MQEDRRIDVWILPLVLALLTLAVFSRSVTFDFVNFDDFEYVASNANVNRGLSVDSFLWALTSNVGSNWHPVTVLTHMADSHVYGIHDAWGHHLTNVLLHSANTALLFLLLYSMTGARWRCVLVAALFAVHPLHVESVTWVSERKDVLSTFFWFGSLWAYSWYVKRPGLGKYILVALLLAMGLMSKPMVVTAPCLMLVLDFWPLRRLFGPADSFRESLVRLGWLAAEKVPFFLIVAITSIITFNVQYARGVRSTEELTLKLRFLNMLAAYGDYITQLIWPTRLSVFYPHPTTNISMTKVYLAGFALLVVSALALTWWRKRSYLLSGWLWYIGTLVPVIGLVQVGGAARADRYTYVPLVGLFIIIAWGLQEYASSGPRPRRLVPIACAIWVVILAGLTWNQQGYWKNSLTLFRHAAEVADARGNFLAHSAIGTAHKLRGDNEAALEEYNNALRQYPRDRVTVFKIAGVLQDQGKWEEAAHYYELVLTLGLDGPGERVALGKVLVELGRYDEAIKHFRTALTIPPSPFTEIIIREQEPRIQLSNALQATQQYEEAATVLEEGLQETPNNADLLKEYAWLRATCPEELARDREGAISMATQACNLSGNDLRSLDVYAAALANALRFSEAVRVAQQAVDLGRLQIESLEEQLASKEWREWEKPPTATLAMIQEQLAGAEARLQLYKQARPYRQDENEG